VLQLIEPISSGEPILRANLTVKLISVKISKISSKVCFNLIQLIDHLLLKLMPTHGCKAQFQLEKRFNKNSTEEINWLSRAYKLMPMLRKLKRPNIQETKCIEVLIKVELKQKKKRA